MARPLAGRRAYFLTLLKSETFSPIMIVVALVLARIQFDQLTGP